MLHFTFFKHNTKQTLKGSVTRDDAFDFRHCTHSKYREHNCVVWLSSEVHVDKVGTIQT